MKLLLTGVTGFIGRNILLRTIAENRYDEIWLLVRNKDKLFKILKEDGFENIPTVLKIKETQGPDWDLKELPEYIDHIIYSAGLINASNLAQYRIHNVDSVVELFKRLKKLPSRAIILSSQAASGPCENGEIKNESSKDNPITNYGRSKLDMERKIKDLFPNLKCIFLRPPIVLGPRDSNTTLLFKLANKKIIFKPGMKPNYYSYISVFDLVSAIFRALENEQAWPNLQPRHFFVAYNEIVSDSDLLKKINALAKKKSPIIGIPKPIILWLGKLASLLNLESKIPNLSTDRIKDFLPNKWLVSSEAFRNTFGWKAFDNIDQTIKLTNNWISSHK